MTTWSSLDRDANILDRQFPMSDWNRSKFMILKVWAFQSI